MLTVTRARPPAPPAPATPPVTRSIRVLDANGYQVGWYRPGHPIPFVRFAPDPD